jgi:hypothetical protein
MPRNVILYRGTEFEKEELAEASKYFTCFRSRMHIHSRDLVIARYSLLPLGEELYRDVDLIGAHLLNSLAEHQYIADLKEWYEDLGDVTPRTWFTLSDFMLACEQEPALKEKSFVLKGATNSKKFSWSSHCFAQTWRHVQAVYFRLSEDGIIGTQPIYIREYVPLKRLCDPIGDVPPVSKEYRFFCLYGEILCGAFYWSSYEEDVAEVPQASDVPQDWLQGIVKRIQASAVVVDVAQAEDGSWQVIELNDLQMSGLSCNSPAVFYKALHEALQRRQQAQAEADRAV